MPHRRRALHKYDPPDLQKSVTVDLLNDQKNASENNSTNQDSSPHAVSVQEQELARAKSAGLLVAFEEEAASSPEIVGTSSADTNELDQWDLVRGDDAILCSDDDDSDDDLL